MNSDEAEPVASAPEPLDVAALAMLIAFVTLTAIGGIFIAIGQTRHAVGCWVTAGACLVVAVIVGLE